MFRSFLKVFVLLALIPAWGMPADGFKVEPEGACRENLLAEKLRQALQPQGARLVNDKDQTVASLWLRRLVPLKKGAAVAAYGALNEGTLVGVINFQARGSDFRGQTIKPGYYSLRYVQIPSDGNHMGAAPSSDFLLLIPVGVDRDLEAQPKFDELVKLSRQASGTNHPSVLLLTSINEKAAAPAIQHREGRWAVVVKTKAQGAAEIDFQIALILIGKADE